jgi:hypothetical protein
MQLIALRYYLYRYNIFIHSLAETLAIDFKHQHNTDMAPLFILYLLPVLLAFVLLHRHYALVYYHFEGAVSKILGFRPAPSTPTDTSPTRYFRISNIPSTWSKDHLVTVIKKQDPGIDEKTVKVSLYPSCNGTGQTALFHLGKRSALVQNMQTEETTYFTISSEGSPVIISIDSHFYDLTPLNTPGNRIIAE